MKKEDKDMLKNEFKIYKAFFGTTKKEIKKNHAREFDERDYEFMDAKLANGKTAGQVLKKADTFGKCYFYALLIGFGMQEGRLVHGILHKLDYTRPDNGSYDVFDHAWMEVDDDLVYDPTAKTVFDREAYEKAFDAEKTKVVSVRELLRNEKSFEREAKVAVAKASQSAKRQDELLALFPKKTEEKTKE